MSEQTYIINRFPGGITDNSEKQGQSVFPKAKFVQSLDIYTDPSYMLPFQKATKDSGSTVVDLVKWAVDGSPYVTDKYFTDSSGNIYKRTSGGSWTVDRNGSDMTYSATGGTTPSFMPTGQGLGFFNDFLYYATQFSLGRKGPLSLGVTTYHDMFIGGVDIGGPLNDQSSSGGAQSYSLPSALAETAANRRSFVPTKDPVWVIAVRRAIVGTGDWTCTVHDQANNSLATLTLTHNTINTTGTFVSFFFTGLIPIVPGNTYHFHITSSDNTGTIVTGTANDESTADYWTFFPMLFNDTDFHPLLGHLNNLVIGNGRYLATWDEVTYDPNRIAFPPGSRVRALAIDQEFLVAATWKGTSIDGYEEGHLYYWDGISPTYNFSKPLPMGLPNAISNNKNRLIGVYGSLGNLYLGSDPFQRIQTMPRLDRSKKVEVYPGALNPWQGVTMVGVAGSTDDSSSLTQGVYTWGSIADDIPESFTMSHVISTGTKTGTSLKIGMVKGFGSELYIGWRDGSSYGVDRVLKTDNPAPSFAWESAIWDNGMPSKQKILAKLVIKFNALTSGDSITPKYKIDRAGNWTSGSAVSTVGATTAVLLVNKRFKELEFGFDGTTSSSTPCHITEIQIVYDDCSEESVDQ